MRERAAACGNVRHRAGACGSVRQLAVNLGELRKVRPVTDSLSVAMMCSSPAGAHTCGAAARFSRHHASSRSASRSCLPPAKL